MDDITPKRVVWSPDGRILAVASTGVYLYDVTSIKLVRQLGSVMGWVEDLAFSPDGKSLVSATQADARVWDIASGVARYVLKGTTGAHAVAFSPDGATFAVGIDKAVKTYKSFSGEELVTFLGAKERVDALAFSPDGRVLAAAGRDAVLWDAATGQELRHLEGHVIRATNLAFAPHDQMLASTTLDNDVRLWDLTGSSPKPRLLKGHTGQVGAVAFSPSGKSLAATSWDLTVRIWDTVRGREALAIKGHTTWITAVAFSPDGEALASGAGDGVRLWRLSTAKQTAWPHRPPTGNASTPSAVEPTAGAITIVNAAQLAPAGYWEEAKAMSLAWSPSRDIIAIGGTGIHLFDGKTRQRLRLLNFKGWLQDIDFSPDGTLLAAASTDGARVWEVDNGGNGRPMPGTRGSKAVAFSPDGAWIALGIGMVVKLFDAAGPTELETLVAAQQTVDAVSFSPDGTLLASGGSAVTLWDLRNGLAVRTLPGNIYRATGLAFSPNGKTLAAAYSDRRLILWDVATGKERWVQRGHEGEVRSAAFSPSGQLIASTSTDLTVRLWDAADGREVRMVKGYTFTVYDAVFSPDGSALLSAGMDGTRLWTIGR